MSKLLVINGSPRKNGSDAAMVKKAVEMAEKYGYESEILWAYDLDLNGCRACMACKKTGECVQKDGMNDVIAKIRDSDMILFATPVYFLAETGPIKTFIDRMYPMMRMNPDRTISHNVGKLKKASVIVTCGAPDGNMVFANILTRFFNVLKMFGVTDVSGGIVPGAMPDTVLDSPYAKEYFSNLEFQLEM